MERRAQSGMTLIEVLVALSILGLAAGSILTMMAHTARFATASEERLLARIAADNVMIELLGRETVLTEGFELGQITLGGRNWETRQDIIDTGMNGLYRIEVRISLTNQNQVLARAETFIGGKQ